MTSSDHPSFTVHAAGATISVEWEGVAADLRRDFEDAWRDAMVPHTNEPDGQVSAAQYPHLRDLATAIRRAARTALASRDVWTVHGAAVVDAGSAIVVLSELVDDRLAVRARLGGHRVSLGHEMFSIDAQGAVLPYREPIGAEPPSVTDGRTVVPAGIRVAAFVFVDSEEALDAERLGLHESLRVLGRYVEGFAGTPAPLRSFARIVAETGGVLRVGRDHLDRLEDALAQRSEDTGRAELPPPPALREGDVTSNRPGVRKFYRSGAVASLDFIDEGVLLLRRTVDGHTMQFLDVEESALWRAADGVERTVLLERAGRGRLLDRAPVEGALANMERDGILAAEPSWRVSDDVTWALEAESAVVLDLSAPHSTPLILDSSACAVWLKLTQHPPIRQGKLIEAVAAEYGLAPDAIASDIDSLLVRLRSANLAVTL